MKSIIDNSRPTLSLQLTAAEHAITRLKIRKLQEALKGANGQTARPIFDEIQSLRKTLPRSEQ